MKRMYSGVTGLVAIALMVLVIIGAYRSFTVVEHIRKVTSESLIVAIESAQRTGPFLPSGDNPTSIRVADMKGRATQSASYSFFANMILSHSSLPLYKIDSLSWKNIFPPGQKPQIVADAKIEVNVFLGWHRAVDVAVSKSISSSGSH